MPVALVYYCHPPVLGAHTPISSPMPPSPLSLSFPPVNEQNRSKAFRWGVGAGQLPKVRQADLVAPEILLVSLRQPCQGWSVTPLMAFANWRSVAESSRTLPLRANPGTLPHWPRAGGKLATPVREELRREPPKAEPSSPVIVHTERQSPRAAALAPSPGSRLPLLGGFCISWTPSARGLAFKRKPQPGTESR